MKQKEPEKARGALKRVLSKYPESAFSVSPCQEPARPCSARAPKRLPSPTRRAPPARTCRGARLATLIELHPWKKHPSALPLHRRPDRPGRRRCTTERTSALALEMQVLSGEGYQPGARGGVRRASALAAGSGAGPVDAGDLRSHAAGDELPGSLRSRRCAPTRATREAPGHRDQRARHRHDAVAAIKLGASDFFEKPLNRERVLV